MAEKIGEWTRERLSRFVTSAVRQSPANLPRSIKLERVEATKTLVVSDDLVLSDRAVRYLKTKLGLP